VHRWFLLKVSYNSLAYIQGQFFLNFLIIYIAASLLLSHCLKQFDKGFSLSKPLLYESLLCSDWSDGPVCCDWSTAYSVRQKQNGYTYCSTSMKSNNGDGFTVSIPVLILWKCMQSRFVFVSSTCPQLEPNSSRPRPQLQLVFEGESK